MEPGPLTPLSTLTARATLARPLHPAALASVPSGIVLVRVRVPVFLRDEPPPAWLIARSKGALCLRPTDVWLPS